MNFKTSCDWDNVNGHIGAHSQGLEKIESLEEAVHKLRFSDKNTVLLL